MRPGQARPGPGLILLRSESARAWNHKFKLFAPLAGGLCAIMITPTVTVIMDKITGTETVTIMTHH